MKKQLDIYTHHYFPFYFIILGFALLPLVVIPVYPLLSVGFFALSFLFITTHFRVNFDREQRKFKEYIWIFGFKNGKEQSLPQVEHIYINRSSRKEEYGLVARLQANKTVYMGFIKLSNGETLFCGESRKEDNLMRKLEKIAAFLDLEIKKNYILVI